MIGTIQFYLFLVLAVVAVALEVWALVHALRSPARSFEAADKRTKPFWVAVLVGATVVGFLSVPPYAPLPVLFLLIAVVPAGIYLADVRPAVARYSGRDRGTDTRW